MKMNYFLLIIFSLFLLSSVYAIGWPHQFYGTVTVNGALADGASVVAKIEGTEFGSTVSVNGNYGYNLPELFFVLDPDGVNQGKTIEFYLNGSKVAEETFINNGVTKLDLSLGQAPFCGDGICNADESCSTCSNDCGACPVDTPPTGGSPGGGGGGGGLLVSLSGKCINQDVNVEVKIYSNKRPSFNANVAVIKENETIVSGKTNEDGIYSFVLEETGDYLLQVTKSGYPKKKLDFSLVDCTIEQPPEDTGEILGDMPENLCENINCNDLNPCTKDSCKEGVCGYVMLEGNPCGEEGTCSASGECILPEKETPPTPTGFFGLSGLQQNIGIILVVVLITGIIFFAWKKKKEE